MLKRNNPIAGMLLVFFARYRIPILGKLYRILLHSDINCYLPKSTHLGHPYGITIHSNAVIGENVTIHQFVTIGANTPKFNDAPVIGDNVFIGTGAVVIGGITVGNNANIGANAVVTKNVPAGSTVIKFNEILVSKIG